MSLRRRPGSAARVLLVLAGAVLTLGVGAVPASAHNVLTATSPANGAQVGPTPGSVVLTFDEPAVAMGTQVLVTGPSGQVQAGPPRLVDDTVTQDLVGGAPPGTYTVAWRVTSVDGHPVSGTFTFTSTQPGAGAPPTTSPAPSTGPAAGPASRGGPVAVLVVGVLVVAAVALVVVVLRRRGRATPDQ